MPSEVRALEMSCGAEGINPPFSSNWGAPFGRGFSTERPAVSDASRPSFVVGMAIKPINLIVFVSDDISGSGSVGDASRTDLLATVMRLLPKGDPVRILNVGDGSFRHVFAKLRDRAGPDRCLFLDLQSTVDPAIEQLARALLKTEGMDDALVELYACAVGLAIATRFVSRDDGSDPSQPKRNCGVLPKWRLKRVLAYIDANFGEPVALADLAAAAGLTRMHFAAQFRRATGIRPHEYLLRQRIERAQQLLSQSRLPIVDVAFSVGFQTQAHFTTVFKRFVGETPHQWRLSNCCEPDLSLERNSQRPETMRFSGDQAIGKSQIAVGK
jgi:AraC-like DNA-binding protein